MCLFRQFGINILDRTDRSRERASVVIAVEGVQQRTILTDQGNFRCGGTCIDTKVAVSFVRSQICGLYMMSVVACAESIVFCLIFE